MISFIKNNPIKSILAVLLTVILSLNYFGFCYSQKRFLSDEEKLNIVVKYILAADFEAIKLAKLDENDKRRKRYLPIKRIPYRDIDEFFTLNPECCTVATYYKKKEGEGDYVSCWNRLIDTISSIVGIKYLERYRDSEGVIHSKPVERYKFITNCGHVWED